MRGVRGRLSILSDPDIKNWFYKEKTLCLGVLVVHEIFGLSRKGCSFASFSIFSSCETLFSLTPSLQDEINLTTIPMVKTIGFITIRLQR
jgi:hypothetical protein